MKNKKKQQIKADS